MILKKAQLFLLSIYQAWSATRMPKCRYIPSCSSYAVEALENLNFLAAQKLIFKRIMRCHPWGSHGYDPVPINLSESKSYK